MRFSQRHGYKPARDAVQFESMDDGLRNSLWNALHEYYLGPRLTQAVCKKLWTDFFRWRLDTLGDMQFFNITGREQALRRVRELYFSAQWHEVYDLVEFIADIDTSTRRATEFRDLVNTHLEREVSAYRFVGGYIVPITGQVEFDEIEAALGGGSGAVSEQLDRALQLLADRQSPDYRNSVKESISAVEGQIKSSLGTDKGTLGMLLSHLEQKEPLHRALKDAFGSLYGYASDEGGIRHALMDDSRTVSFEEAKFMLVVCSAFINYVRGVTEA